MRDDVILWRRVDRPGHEAARVARRPDGWLSRARAVQAAWLRFRRQAMEIRPAVADDADALATLNAQLGYPCSAAEMTARLSSMRTRPDHEVLVACIDAAPVGWIHVFRNVTLESGSSAVIGGLVVDAARRDAGVGTALLAAAENWARLQGEAAIRVRSRVIRKEAHRFYEERGYVRTKEQVVFDKPLG